jgi:glycine/D-amino acid oxidase-like deaminating enzyme
MNVDNAQPVVQQQSRECEVLVVGGGVTGCSVARELAPDHDVLVLEKGEIAGRASGLSMGLISPSQFYHDMPDAAHHSNQFFRSFDGTGGFEFTERRRVGLIDPDLEAEFRDRAARLASCGFPTSFYGTGTLKDLYPQFDASGFAGAIEYRSHGWVNPYVYTHAQKRVAESHGAEFRPGAEVTDLLVEEGRVVGAETRNYRIRAPLVICAAGWMTQRFLEPHGVSIPVRPFKYQLAVLDPGWTIGDGFPMGHIERGLTFRPMHNGNLLVDDSAGGFVDDPDRTSTGVDADADFLARIPSELPGILPAFEGADVLHHWAGAVGITPDVRPIVDTPERGPDGLLVAQAGGAGILGSPVVATAVRSLVTDDSAPFAVTPFSLDRFDSRSPDFGLEALPLYFQE